MFTRRLGRLLNRVALSSLARLTSALALVAAITGLNVAVAQGATTELASKPVAAAALSIVTASSTTTVFSVASDGDMDNDNEEMEEEEFEEDGLRPSGQAEQREQKKGEKSETKNEDAPAPE